MADKKKKTVSYESTRLADYTYDNSIERGSMDLPFALLALLLLTIGVIMVLSASYARAYYDLEGDTGGNATYYFVRQTLFALCGIGVMFVCSRFPMGFYRRMSWMAFMISLALLAAVILIGVVGGGSRRWIDLGFTTFQPSELAKISLVMFFALRLSRNRDDLTSVKGLVPYVVAVGAIAVLLALEPHWSAIMIILIISLVMLFVGGAPIKWFVGGLASAAGLMGIAWLCFDYIRNRIAGWLDPFSDMADTGYQVVQSLYAVGSGGLLGLGLGNSRQKYLYLPEEHNDYIFAVLCEELGFIGAMLVLTLFALLIIRGYWLAMHARDRYSCLMGVGITTLIAMQVILNVCVVTNLLPSTGVSLPLFSYGGTALLIQMAEIGIILSLSRDIPEKR